MCPYLITEVCGINLGLKRRKSLKRRDCIKISVDKERPPPQHNRPLWSFCPLLLPLCYPTDNGSPWSGGLINDGKTACTDLPQILNVHKHTHAHTHKPGNGNCKKSPRSEQHVARFKAASVSNNQTDDRHKPQPEVRDTADTRHPPTIIQAADAVRPQPPLHFNLIHTDTHAQKHLNSDASSRADEIRLFSVWINRLIISHFIIRSIKCVKNGC